MARVPSRRTKHRGSGFGFLRWPGKEGSSLRTIRHRGVLAAAARGLEPNGGHGRTWTPARCGIARIGWPQPIRGRSVTCCRSSRLRRAAPVSTPRFGEGRPNTRPPILREACQALKCGRRAYKRPFAPLFPFPFLSKTERKGRNPGKNVSPGGGNARCDGSGAVFPGLGRLRRQFASYDRDVRALRVDSRSLGIREVADQPGEQVPVEELLRDEEFLARAPLQVGAGVEALAPSAEAARPTLQL